VDLPIHGVQAPGHFFPRFSDERNHINIETTKKGESFGDEYYGLIFKTPVKDLRNLSKKEFLIKGILQRGWEYLKKGDFLEKALDDANTALEFDKEDLSAKMLRCTTYLKKEKYDNVLSDALEVHALTPTEPGAIYSIAVACFGIEQPNAAIPYLDSSISQNAGDIFARTLRAMACSTTLTVESLDKMYEDVRYPGVIEKVTSFITDKSYQPYVQRILELCQSKYGSMASPLATETVIARETLQFH